MLLDVTNKQIKAVALVPYVIASDRVRKAWAYAVKYSANLNEPDYEAAAKLMMQRHPRWAVALRIQKELTLIPFDPNKAAEDTPELPETRKSVVPQSFA